MIEQWVTAIASIGFPAMVCIYCLTTINRTMETLGGMVNENTVATKEMIILIRERL